MNEILIKNENLIERSYYEEAFDDIKNYVFKNLKFVKHILRYGNLKHPGISDLDFMLIIKIFQLTFIERMVLLEHKI